MGGLNRGSAFWVLVWRGERKRQRRREKESLKKMKRKRERERESQDNSVKFYLFCQTGHARFR